VKKRERGEKKGNQTFRQVAARGWETRESINP